MAKKFFPDEWEKISAEEMIRARARLSGFIESIPEKDKAIRDVSIKRWKTWCLLEPDGLYIHSAWWAKGEFTPENLSHWKIVKGMIIPSKFRLMGEGKIYSRECISLKICKRDDYS